MFAEFDRLREMPELRNKISQIVDGFNAAWSDELNRPIMASGAD
jgi:hypothetical protein